MHVEIIQCKYLVSTVIALVVQSVDDFLVPFAVFQEQSVRVFALLSKGLWILLSFQGVDQQADFAQTVVNVLFYEVRQIFTVLEFAFFCDLIAVLN